MLNDNHINGPAQGGRVDGVPSLGDARRERPDVLHVRQQGQSIAVLISGSQEIQYEL